MLDEVKISKLKHQIDVYIEESFLFESAFEKDRRSKTMKDYKIAVAGTGARDIIGSTKKTYDN